MNLIKLLQNNIFKNVTSLTFNHGIQVLIQLFFIPLFLTYWDLNTYSEWILISTIPVLLSISELGLTSYGSNQIIILTKQNKINKANFVLQNIIYFTSLLLILAACIIFILDFFLNFQKIFNITSIDQSEFFFVLLFIFLRYLIFSNSNFIRDLYRINHKFHISIYIKSFFTITEIILIWLALLYGGQILEIIFISLLNYLVAFFIIYLLIKKEFKWLKIINFKNINLSFIKKIFYPSISFMTGNISKGLIAQSTIVLLNFFSNDAFIIFYNSLRLIINGARHFINIISTSYYPEITINYAKKKINKISNQFKFLFKYNFYSSTIIFIIIILFLKEPFLIWTKNEIAWDFNFFIIFVIANYVEWVGIPIITIPYAINKAEILNKIFIILFILYILLLFILLPIQQTLAVPIALIFANLYGLIHSWLKLKKNITLNLIIK